MCLCIEFQVSYLWDSSLKHKVFHIKGRGINCRNDDDSNTWMIWWRIFGKMERHMDTAMII